MICIYVTQSQIIIQYIIDVNSIIRSLEVVVSHKVIDYRYNLEIPKVNFHYLLNLKGDSSLF